MPLPTPDEILAGLADIASDNHSAGVIWHGALLFVLVALALGFRPYERHARLALVFPLASVSAFSWSYGNPFNGMVFSISAVLLALMGAFGPTRHRVQGASRPFAMAAFILIALGGAYPHFSPNAPLWRLLYDSPFGLIPCPTLLVVIGLTLLGRGLGSFSWTVVSSVLGVFYGAFGGWRLGVTIDWVLVAGSLLLLLQGVRGRRLG